MNLKYLSIVAVGFAVFSYMFFIKKADTKKSSEKIDNATIVVGTSADYPPFAAVDSKTNEIVGFDIDIVTEVAKRLGKRIEIKDIPFAGLIFGLLSGDIDVIAAGMSPSAKRAQTVSFSDQYMQPDPFVIISKKSEKPVQNIGDLIGKRVSVNTGYTAEAYLADREGLDLIRLTTPAESIMALKSGAVDAFVCAQSVVNTMLGKDSPLQDLDFVVVSGTGDGCALAVNKNDAKLLDEINVALDEMKQDGTLAMLKEKWNLK